MLSPFSYMKETFHDAIYNNDSDDEDDIVEDMQHKSSNCPACGAPVTDIYADSCPYCSCVYPWRNRNKPRLNKLDRNPSSF